MQQINRTDHRTTSSKRRGLAPLELVLSLPIMMFVLALIIDFGNMAPWKVRAAVVAREAVWRQHWPHRGGNNPVPAGWARPNPVATKEMPFKDASLGREEQPSTPGRQGAPDMQTILGTDPFAQHTVVRGPTAVPNSPLTVDTTKVNFPDGLYQGLSYIEIRLPLLPALRHAFFNLWHPLLDKQFQFGPMGYGSNDTRRALYLYSLSMNQSNLPQLAQAYSQSVQRVFQIWANQNPTEFSPATPGVLTLDRDDEFQKYHGNSPDFHPQVRGPRGSNPPCETDRDQVRLTRVIGPSGVVDKIQGPQKGGQGGLPDSIASAFIGLYQEQINILQAQQPPPQAQIDALQKKIEQLNQFKGSLH